MGQSLCPANEPITEKCFQKTTLRFVGDFHKIRRLDNTSLPEPEYTIPAMQVSEGTFPVGSTCVCRPSAATWFSAGQSAELRDTVAKAF